MSTTRKVAYNTVTQVGGSIVVAALSIISLRLITHYFSATTYGYLVAVTAFLGLFAALSDLGLSTISGREIAKSPEETAHIVGLNLSLRFIISLLVLPIVIVGGLLLYHRESSQIRIGILILSTTLVIGSTQAAVGSVFVANVRNDLSAAINVITKLIAIAGVVAVIHFGLGYYGYLWSMVGLAFFSSLLTLTIASRFTRLRPIFDQSAWRQLLKISLPLGVIQVINMIYLYIDSILLSIMRPAAEVGYYGVSYSVITFVMTIPSFFMLALMPALATADDVRLRRVIQKAFDFLIVLAVPFLIGGILLSHYIIAAISNASFLPAVPAFNILMIGAAVSFVNAVYGNAIVATGHEKRLVRLGFYVVVINIMLNLIFIPRFGIAGAASATSVTEIFGMFYVTKLFRSITSFSATLAQVPKAIGAGAAMLCAYLLLMNIPFFNHTGWSQLLLLVSLLSAAYVAVLAALGGLRKEMFVEILRRRG